MLAGKAGIEPELKVYVSKEEKTPERMQRPERVICGPRWLLRTQDLCSYIIRDLACSIKTRMPLIVPRALWHPGSVWHPCLLLSLMAFCLLSRRGDQECLGHEGLRVLAAGIRCHSSVTLCRGDCFVFVSVTFFLPAALYGLLCDFGWLMMLLCFRLCWGLLFWAPFVLVWSFGSWRGTLDINGMC